MTTKSRLLSRWVARVLLAALLPLAGCVTTGGGSDTGPFLVFTPPGADMVSSAAVSEGASIGAQLAGPVGSVVGSVVGGLAGIVRTPGDNVNIQTQHNMLNGSACGSTSFSVKPTKMRGDLGALRWYLVSKDSEGDWVFEEAPARYFKAITADPCYQEYVRLRKAYPKIRGGVFNPSIEPAR